MCSGLIGWGTKNEGNRLSTCQQLGPELERSGCSLKYTECGREVGLGQLGGCRDLRAVATKSGTERVVVALLLGALIIIFLTLVAYCNTKYFLQL